MRKRRTRSHIIADLSANHVERHILLCGFSSERVLHDYGIDMLLHTYTADGEVENETVGIQLKATDHIRFSRDSLSVLYSADRADLYYWLEERYPVILIVYDAQNDSAYWVYVQEYFQTREPFAMELVDATVTIRLLRTNVVDKDAIHQFAEYKALINRRLYQLLLERGDS